MQIIDNLPVALHKSILEEPDGPHGRPAVMLPDELLHCRAVEGAVDLPGGNRPRLEVVHVGNVINQDVVDVLHLERFGISHPGPQGSLLDAAGLYAG